MTDKDGWTELMSDNDPTPNDRKNGAITPNQEKEIRDSNCFSEKY